MKTISTRKLIKNAFLAIFKPHRAFKEISQKEKINYKIVILLTLIWGAIFIILNFAFAQRSWIFQWSHAPITLISQAIYGFLLWFGGSLIFFSLAKILKKKVSLNKIEIGVFYLWMIWAIMPFFDLPHLLFKIPMIDIFGRGAHLSWFFAFPALALLTFFFLKDILKFKRKELILAGCFSVFLPLLGRFVLEDIPIFLNNFLRLFNKPAGFANCALLATVFCLFLSIFLRIFLLKKITFRSFVLRTTIISFALIFVWLWAVYFTNFLIFSTGGKTFSNIFFHKTNDFVKGRSRWTASYTWTSPDKESGTIQHPASGAGNDNSDSYWSDTYSSGSFDFTPSNVTVQELRVRVHFTSATVNNQSGAGPKAQGCWQVGTSSTYYCSAWTTNLNGASTQTFTISSSSIYTYVASGDGAAAGTTEWQSLVSNLQSGGENIIVHTWTQGDGNGNTEGGDKIAFDEVYAEVYYTGGDFTQHTYRWYVNTDAIQPTDPWPAGATNLSENTPITTSDSPPTSGDVLRLRMNIKGAMNQNTESFKLQYGEGSTCSSISTWTDVGAIDSASIWRGYNNATPADGATVTANLLSNSTKTGTYEEANNSATNPVTAQMSDYTEYDWVIQDNGAPENTTYCFRMVQSNGTPLDVYTNYPQLTTKPSIITQRAYIFENDDGADVNSNSNIASANTALTNVLRGQRFIARIQIDETNSTATGLKTYKLQYDKDGDGNWTDVWMGGGVSSNSGGNFGEWNLKTVYSTGSVGNYNSIAVGTDGFPIISFYDSTNADLMVCKCQDTACIKTPICTTLDSTGDVGKYTAIAISNDSGKPVIAYRDNTNSKLKVCKCGNTSCSSGNVCTTVKDQSATDVGCGDNRLSMAIGTDGYPVIAFNNGSNALRVCKCADDSCSSNATCTVVYSATSAARWTSIAIGQDGYPVISFDDWSNLNLMFVHCTNASCSTFDTPVTIEGASDNSGDGSSIAIGKDGNPVISHFTDSTTSWGDDLRLCKCGNATCTSGNTCNSIYTQAQLGNYSSPETSLAIGKDGFPIIVHGSYGSVNLRYVKCNDAACSGGYPNEFYQVPDSGSTSDTSIHRYASIAIGQDGYPVVAYYDKVNDDLKVAKMLPVSEIQASWGLSGSSGDSLTSAKAGTCYTGTTWQNGAWYEATGQSGEINLGANKCTEIAFVIDTSRATVGVQYRLRLVKSDGTVLNSYSQYPTFTIVTESGNTKRYFKIPVTTTASGCATGITDYACGAVDTTNDVGRYSSIAIGPDGYPVISNYDFTNHHLRFCKCKSTFCSVITCRTIDSADYVGTYSSIAIGTDGYPVISYSKDSSDGACDSSGECALKVIKCNDPECSGGDETISMVDNSGNNKGQYYSSIAIGTDGNPVISYWDGDAGALRVAKCGNPSCSSGNTITTVDDPTNWVGYYSSIAIGPDGNPVISYYDYGNGTCDATGECGLKVAKCGNPSCSSGNTITMVDDSGTGDVGRFTSIAIGTDGNPVISYTDVTNGDLKVVKCSNSACSATNTITTVDSVNDVGWYTSIAIGTDGFPMIAHYDNTNGDLRFCKCGNTSCSSGNNCITLDSTNNVGATNSLAISIDGWPIISYYDTTNGNLRIAKGVGLPKTAISYFGNFIKNDRQIKFKSDAASSQFLEHWPWARDGLLYWLDKKGYDDVLIDDASLDQITSASTQAPVYEFIDKHSSNTNNIYARWIGQSTVAASTDNIKLEIYNWNTNSWETITTNSTCSADTDCIIDGSITSNLSYYYFPRYNYDSTKQKNNITVEYYTYWRVYQATGSQTLKTDYWKVRDVPFLTVSGNAYENETSTPLSICNGTTNMIALRVGGTTYGPVSCSASDGSFAFTDVIPPSQGTPMILWIDGQSSKASTVYRYSGSGDATGLELRKDRLMIMSGSGNVTNADLDTWDSSNDSDIIYLVDSNNLTLADGYKLIVKSSVTYQPGGTITTSPSADSSTTDGDILIQSSATLNMESNNLSIGGDFTNQGTFSKSTNQQTTFTATATGHTIAHGTATFENVIFNGTGGGWSFNSNVTINQDLTMTAGTLFGTNDITVNGGDTTGNGTINLTGGTFLLDGTGNFGGDTNWTFYNLTFGDGTGTATTTKTGSGNITITNILTIAANQTLDASDDTWTLSGIGTPFVISGVFTPSTSTFSYIGNGATNVTAATYYNLSIGTSNSANITYTAAGNIVVNNALNLQSAATGYTNTFSMSSYNLTVGLDSVANSGGISVPTGSAITQASPGTTTVKSSSAGSAIIGGAGSTQFYNFTVGTASDNLSYTFTLGGAITISNDFLITAGGTGTHTLDVTTSNYQITVGGNWTNNGVFTCQQGTVTFNATTTGKTITDGGSPFYNIVFNGSGGGWLYQDGASTAPNSTAVQAGEVTFLNAKTGTVSVTGGTLNVDWYLGAHLVDAANTSTNIDTQDNDITISENSSTPQQTVWRYDGSSWGTPSSSKTTGTDSSGKTPQPNSAGAIRIREYSMTNSSQCPGSGCTLYKYNLQVDWQANYGFYDYYEGYGKKYITSCLSGSSSSCQDDSTADDVIGQNWYRQTPGTMNGTPPYDGLNEPPLHGSWYIGMINALEVSISNYDIDFGTIQPGSSPTNQQNTITVQTGASNGYIVYAFSTQAMTHTSYPSVTIPDWSGTNANPTTWSSGEGFGYSTDDYTLTGGTQDRFSGPKYAGFSHIGPGDPVADRTGPTLSSNGQNTITYRLGTLETQAAGSYATTVLFVVTPVY